MYKWPASDKSKASAPIEGRSFAEAREQDELYSRHELETGFRKDLIDRAEDAFKEAVKIL